MPGKDGSARLSINSPVIPSVHLPIADRPHRLVAEIELGAEDEALTLPSWVGADVTGDRRYSNAVLAESGPPLD